MSDLPSDKLQNTPRTDAFEENYPVVKGKQDWPDFARDLERELEAMRATWSESNRCYLEQFDRAERLQGERDALKSATRQNFIPPHLSRGWETARSEHGATCHSIAIGGVLCRWWGEEVPPGVAALDEAFAKYVGVKE